MNSKLIAKSIVGCCLFFMLGSCATMKKVGFNLAEGLGDGLEESSIDSTVSAMVANILDSLEVHVKDVGVLKTLEGKLDTSLTYILQMAEHGVTGINDSLIGIKAEASIRNLSRTINEEAENVFTGVGRGLKNSELDLELKRFFKESIKGYLENAVSGLTAQITSDSSINGFQTLADSLTYSLGEGLNFQAIRLSDTLVSHLKPPLEKILDRIDKVGQSSVLGLKEIIGLLIGGIILIGLCFFLFRTMSAKEKLSSKYKDTEKILEIVAKNISQINDQNTFESLKDGISLELSKIGLEQKFRFKLANLGIINTTEEKMMYKTVLDEVASNPELKMKLKKQLEEKGFYDMADKI